ncbi:SsrA-binding protein SmpB [Gammaproteobacteria bacterium]|jgi:SsrA-binding protein|nr:SsrA-binding protein SmpB [Gammaproteobacteria bacterium]|tara:strand:+ start:218 stop:700 length:483 start_codon:yes stop_codon:yes gene_type:complete
MGQRTKNTENIIAVNKKATHDYFILEKLEAGIVLEGWEVKGIRALKVQIKEAYVKIIRGEVLFIGSNITPLSYINRDTVKNATRTRKLLLNQKEINTLIGKIKREGLTIIPMLLYWKNNKVKLQLGVAKGKKKFDKRQSEKNKDWAIEKSRVSKIKLRSN